MTEPSTPPSRNPDPSHNPGSPHANIPSPDPSALTTDALREANTNLRDLLESQVKAVKHDLEVFREGHEEKHVSVVTAAIQHRKELSDASIAIVQAQVDAQYASQQEQLRQVRVDFDARLEASDLRYQQRYDAQSDALRAAFDAQQNATSAALASAKEAVQTALAASEQAVGKAETATEKLIPRAEVEAQFNYFADKVEVRRRVVDEHIAALQEAVKPLSGLSDKLEKTVEAVSGLDRVTDAKFVTFRTLIDSQADKVALALTAANKAVDAAFTTSQAAITKAEAFNEKRFDLISKQMDELKSYRDSTTGKGEGAAALWGLIAGGVGLIAALIAIFLTLSGG